MAWVVLFKNGGRYFVMMTHDGSVRAFESEVEGMAHFEHGYNQSHARSYESSMSAAINWMTFQPSVVRSAGLDELKKWIGEDHKVLRLSHVSGTMLGAEVSPKLGQELWEAGGKPRLISEEFNKVRAEQPQQPLS